MAYEMDYDYQRNRKRLLCGCYDFDGKAILPNSQYHMMQEFPSGRCDPSAYTEDPICSATSTTTGNHAWPFTCDCADWARRYYTKSFAINPCTGYKITETEIYDCKTGISTGQDEVNYGYEYTTCKCFGRKHPEATKMHPMKGCGETTTGVLTFTIK